MCLALLAAGPQAHAVDASPTSTAPPPQSTAATAASATSPTTAPSTTSAPATQAGIAFDSLDTPDPRGASHAKVPQARAGVTLRIGQFGPRIATAQQQLAWLGHDIRTQESQEALFGRTTRDAVRSFQTKHWLPATGRIDKRTRHVLSRMSAPIGVLPRTCTETPMSLCIDKTAKVLRFVVKGEVKLTTDARFGAPGMETDEGIFAIKEKSRDHVSSRFHTWMPFAMFFNGDEAVHYSPDFAAVGYLHGSHGCVGVRDMEKVTWLFDHVPVGTRVYVYWS